MREDNRPANGLHHFGNFPGAFVGELVAPTQLIEPKRQKLSGEDVATTLDADGEVDDLLHAGKRGGVA